MLDVRAEAGLSTELSTAALEKLLVAGDISGLSPAEKLIYYKRMCEATGLDWTSQPFDYLVLNKKEILYPNAKAAAQLRDKRGISITKVERVMMGDCFGVTVYGIDSRGRTDSSTGVVYIKNLTGEFLSNAMMRAETKAKRRLTLSLAGLGMIDESEVDSIPGAQRMTVDLATGEVLMPQTEVTEEFTPIRAQAPERDDDTIVSEDDALWKRWLVVQGEATKVGVIVPKVGLPMKRARLAEIGRGVSTATAARMKRLQEQDAKAQAPVVGRDAPEVKELTETLTSLSNMGYEQPTLHITSYPTTLELVNANLAAARKVLTSLDKTMTEVSETAEGRF